MALQGYALTCGSVPMLSCRKAPYPKALSLPYSSRPLPAKVSYPINQNSWRPYPKLVAHCKGTRTPCLSSASSPLLKGGLGSLPHIIPKFTKKRQSNLIPRASKDVPYSHRRAPTTEKPKWWWRTLACLPYMLPLHETLLYAETSYHIHPFLEDFGYLTYPFLGVLARLPSWFMFAYFLVSHLGIVRRKECPHFFRFHLVMSMLLEMALQVIGSVSGWMPLSVYWGKLGMYYWAVVAFTFLFTVVECVRCALAGKYADVPFVSDTAYIQIPYR
ncbi:OLC1v1012385C1 [Oldenlandia corymbosa var. corymbosa]|uniref:Protein TIC 20 n=1 Tax=Oldenlandia corymbosa var. corymbosa TaxID=529605 RepID=A0AAV1DVV6_OLDCO|nr:OLC1v1012385C1 [Oldenlandia corymbosa var. corymbosa]